MSVAHADEEFHANGTRARACPWAGSVERLVVESCAIIPAYEAAATVGRVVDDLRDTLGVAIVVVDDGSTDATGYVAGAHGAHVVRHDRNQGKGAAIETGLREAARRGARVAVTVDADGQHPGASARSVLCGSDDPRAMVLGVRDLVRAGAPRSNRFGNDVSNFFLSRFAGRRLRDTQCGLRRYPVTEVLALGARARGFAFEAEVLLRAVAAGLPVVEVRIPVVYPPPGERTTHFRKVRDPAHIVATVVRTAVELRTKER
jgi:glycosyltransferase involved in cell wall biosynthesis